MSPKKHILVSVALGASVVCTTGSVSSGVACLLAGTAVDLDHFYDYFRHFGFKFSIEKFFLGRHFVESGRNFILLHSYELLPFMLAFFYYLNLPQLGIAISIGFLGHLLCDQFVHRLHPLNYFFCFRLWHNFRILGKQPSG